MDLRGWDTLCALTFDEVNRSLASAGSALARTFALEPGPEALPLVRAEGEFAAWCVTPGGAGQLLRLELPFASGTLVTLRDGRERKAELGGLAVHVQVSLALLPSGGDVGEQLLDFDFRAVGRKGEAELGLVTPLQVVDPEARLTTVEKALLLMQIAEWLVEHAGALSHVFARVTGVANDRGGLAPVASRYAVLETLEGPGRLAILSVVDERPVDALPVDIAAALPAGGSDGCFAVSKRCFLERAVLPTLPGAFGNGATPGHFSFDGETIRNTTPLATQAIKAGALWYQPHLDSVAMSLSGGTLTTVVEGTCDMGIGITLRFHIESRNAAAFDPATQRLTFQPDPSPVERHDSEVPWYLWLIFLPVLPIIAIVIGAIVPAIASDIAWQLTQGFAKSAPADPTPWVRWGDVGRMEISDAVLADGFYVLGNRTSDTTLN